MPNREGFVCAGTWCLEHVKTIARYPAPGAQATMVREHVQAGGSAFDILTALRECDPELPLYALGMIGDDEDGRTLLAACHKQEVDTFQLQTTTEAPTAHAVVIHSLEDDSRTRFYSPGANHLLGMEHFDFKHCLARWFHLSDYLLLDRLHAPEEKNSGKILQAARAAGLITAVTLTLDVPLTEVAPMLQNLDYLILAAQGHNANLAQGFVPRAEEMAERCFAHGLLEGFVQLEPTGVFAKLRAGESAQIEFSSSTNAKNLSACVGSAYFLYGRYSAWRLERGLASALPLE